ncbi:hypothetical protein OC842_002368 [Tilletia horrida]|uniref:Uncharacterized protein n=1 Tax=Tilletia horrida TaxID=155126 RepID=A0AAN6JLP6_9BASI|nr:hypothetical protein OC842_002368 [Tilletia horrida]
MRSVFAIAILTALFAIVKAETLAFESHLTSRNLEEVDPDTQIIFARASDLDLDPHAGFLRSMRPSLSVAADVLPSRHVRNGMAQQRRKADSAAITLARRGGNCSKGGCFGHGQPSPPSYSSPSHAPSPPATSPHASAPAPAAAPASDSAPATATAEPSGHAPASAHQLPPFFYRLGVPLSPVSEGNERSSSSAHSIGSAGSGTSSGATHHTANTHLGSDHAESSASGSHRFRQKGSSSRW